MTERRLSLKQERFIEYYTGECEGNATEAAKKAGYKGNSNQLSTIGEQNLRKLAIVNAIAVIRAKLSEEQGYTRDKCNAEYEQFRQIALVRNDVSGGVSAVRGKAKLFGLDIDRVQTEDLTKSADMDEKRRLEAKRIASIRLQEA